LCKPKIHHKYTNTFRGQFVTQAASPSNASQRKHMDPTNPTPPTLRLKTTHCLSSCEIDGQPSLQHAGFLDLSRNTQFLAPPTRQCSSSWLFAIPPPNPVV